MYWLHSSLPFLTRFGFCTTNPFKIPQDPFKIPQDSSRFPKILQGASSWTVSTGPDFAWPFVWTLLKAPDQFGSIGWSSATGILQDCWLCWVIKWRIGQLLMDRAERDRESCLDNFDWSWRCLTFRLDIVEGSWPVRVDWLVICDRDPAGLLTLLTEEVEDRSAVNGWNRKRPRKLVIRWGSWRFFEVGWVLLKAYGCCTALKSVGHPCSMILEQLLQKELCAISIAATKYGRWISTDSFSLDSVCLI